MAAVYILSAVFAVIFILLLIRVIVQRKMAYVMEQDRAVFETRTAVLGGVEQTVLLEGARRDLPVMLMLHGGPWGPVIFGEAYRGYYRTLSAHYILVWWDQYGCGKNYSKDVSGDILRQLSVHVCREKAGKHHQRSDQSGACHEYEAGNKKF